MIWVLLNWVYAGFTMLVMGFGFSVLISKKFGYQIKSMVSMIAAGLVAATVYAQCFSLFYKVGIAANILLVVLCVAILVFKGKVFWEFLCSLLRGTSTARKLVVAAFILLWAYFTSRGYMHYDSDLYHAQSIRWIEEYGVVKGLGNIHVRFAYNSSFFALCALYSMKFAVGQSLHTMNGFVALLLCIETLGLVNVFGRKKLVLSDFARLGAFYYLTTIYSEVTAPASDYVIMCAVFYIIIRWLDIMEDNTIEGAKSAVPYAILCVGGVFAVTLKLTAGVILLLTLKPAYMLIKEKKWGQIAAYMAMGILTALPWLIRTVVISGYILYPFPALDVFAVDWKIPTDAALLDAAEIKTWGRGINNAALVNMPISQWFPNWFSTMLPAVGKLLVITDVICVLLSVLFFIYHFINAKKATVCNTTSYSSITCHNTVNNNTVNNFTGQMLVICTVELCYIFWQLSAPLLRYGYAYVLLAALLPAGWMICRLSDKCNKKMCVLIYRISVVILVLFTIAKGISLVRYAYSVCGKPYYVYQQDYGKYELNSYEVQGVAFYYPANEAESDRTGYDSFPAIPRKIEIRLRGETLKEGFVTTKPEVSCQ